MKTHYGIYGGQYVAETLIAPLKELETAYEAAKNDPTFAQEFNDILRDYVGRESPITYARRLSEHLGGARILLKREDLNHTGAHKVNNTIGQALLAKRMGKKPPWPLYLACRATSTWAQLTWNVRRPMSNA